MDRAYLILAGIGLLLLIAIPWIDSYDFSNTLLRIFPRNENIIGPFFQGAKTAFSGLPIPLLVSPIIYFVVNRAVTKNTAIDTKTVYVGEGEPIPREDLSKALHELTEEGMLPDRAIIFLEVRKIISSPEADRLQEINRGNNHRPSKGRVRRFIRRPF